MKRTQNKKEGVNTGMDKLWQRGCVILIELTMAIQSGLVSAMKGNT